MRADVFRGKPIIREMRVAVEHVMGMLAARDTPDIPDMILRQYPILESEDIQALPTICPSRTRWRACNERISVR